MSLAIEHFYRFGDFTVDTDQKILLRNGAPLPVTPKVFDTLLILIENSGRIVEKQKLMDQLWPDSFVEESNLTFNIQQLRKSLGDDARHPRYIETVARRGYRFIAPVEEVLSDSGAAARKVTHRFETLDALSKTPGNSNASVIGPATSHTVESATSSDFARPRAGTTHARRLDRKSVAVLATMVVMLLAGWLLWRRWVARPQASAGRMMLAVLPFKNLTGDEAQDYFSDGLTEEMIARLGNLDPAHFGVIARTSVMHYKNSQEPLDKIGRELGVQYVLEGSVRRELDKVRITAQLIRVEDQTHFWAREYDRELSHLLSLQGEIAQEVADEIRLTLGDHRQTNPASQASSSVINYEAYDLYLKGQYFWNKRTAQSLQEAINYFQQATAKDPKYARAYAGLANSYALMSGYSSRPEAEFMPKARTAAVRALELDDSLPEAHTALALIIQSYDWDWQTAEKEFRRAIELNPNYVTAHHWYAEQLGTQGRFDEALRESERARELDPLSLIIAADRAAILYQSRQYDRAIEQCRAVLELEPAFPRAHHMLVFAYVQEGRFAEALADIETWHDDPTKTMMLAYVYGCSGQRAAAEQQLARLQELNRRKQIDSGVMFFAFIGIGDKEQALATLERGYSQHSNVLRSLKVDPIFDPLRNDPRFQDLLKRVGLVQ